MHSPTSSITSIASSAGLIILANYLSSPSSTGSQYNGMPLLLGGSSQTQLIEEEDGPADLSTQALWLYKPREIKYGTYLKTK